MKKDDQIKRWISNWKTADASLKSIRIMELREDNYYLKNRDILNSMLQYAFDRHVVRTSSGLVDQQNIFQNYHLKNLRASR